MTDRALLLGLVLAARATNTPGSELVDAFLREVEPEPGNLQDIIYGIEPTATPFLDKPIQTIVLPDAEVEVSQEDIRRNCFSHLAHAHCVWCGHDYGLMRGGADDWPSPRERAHHLMACEEAKGRCRECGEKGEHQRWCSNYGTFRREVL